MRTNLPSLRRKPRVERRDEIALIERVLRRDEDRVAAAVLRGPPGCGKSWLGSAYAESASADYRVIWRLRAESETTLRADLLDLALELSGPALGAQEERLVESALAFINTAGADCLFIFDNADESDLIEGYGPQSGAARVLVITSLDSRPRRGEVIEIPPWPSDAGADFLLAYTGSIKERREAEELSENLGGLPLALALAAAYCAETGTGFAEYRHRLEAVRPQQRAGAVDAGELNGAVGRAYALSVAAAAARHAAARRLMESAALLGPGPLPLTFFSDSYLPLTPRPGRPRSASPIKRSLAVALAGLTGRTKGRTEDAGVRQPTGWRPLSKEEVIDAVATLASFGLVHSGAISANDSSATPTSAIELHPLLRKVILATSDLATVEATLHRAMPRLLSKEAESGEPLSRKARSLRTMAMALLDASAATGGRQEEAISLHTELARSFRDAGSALSVPIGLFEKAIALRERRFGAESETLSPLLAETAALYAEQGGQAANARAVALFEKALAIDEARGADNSALPLRLSELALALRRLRGRENLERARKLYLRALEIDENREGADAPIVAIRLANLAAALEEIGGGDNLEQCRKLLERALRIEDAAFGEEHPYVALRLTSLAWTLKRLGGAENLGLAASFLVRALKIEEAASGVDHPHVAIRLSNLALVLKEIDGADNLALAAMCLERALVIDMRTIGEADPEHAKHLSNLAAILVQLGGDENLKRAEHCQREALRLDVQNLGKDHPQIALDLLALSEILTVASDVESLAAAQELVGEAAELLQKTRDLEHSLDAFKTFLRG